MLAILSVQFSDTNTFTMLYVHLSCLFQNIIINPVETLLINYCQFLFPYSLWKSSCHFLFLCPNLGFILSYLVQAAVTNHQRLDGLNNKQFYSHSSSAGEDSLEGFRWPTSDGTLTGKIGLGAPWDTFKRALTSMRVPHSWPNIFL